MVHSGRTSLHFPQKYMDSSVPTFSPTLFIFWGFVLNFFCYFVGFVIVAILMGGSWWQIDGWQRCKRQLQENLQSGLVLHLSVLVVEAAPLLLASGPQPPWEGAPCLRLSCRVLMERFEIWCWNCQTICDYQDHFGRYGNGGHDDPVPPPNVNTAIFRKISQWCPHPRDDSPLPKMLRTKKANRWYPCLEPKTPESWPRNTFLKLILAANSPDIKGLHDVPC